MKYSSALVILICVISSLAAAGPFGEFAVSSSDNTQEKPDVEDGIVIWQEYKLDTESGEYDYDVFWLDAIDTSSSVFFLDWEANQTNPKISRSRLIFQDDYYGADDQDIVLVDVTDTDTIFVYNIAASYDDETHPAISGNTLVWQSNSGTAETPNWDIAAADVIEPNNPTLFYVDTTEANQQSPAIYRNRVVYDEVASAAPGDHDVWSVDIWNRNDFTYSDIAVEAGVNDQQPAIDNDMVVWHETSLSGDDDIYLLDLSEKGAVPGALITHTGDQRNADISGNIVVWQDNRNGNWDIYGYNLVTGQEFAITDDEFDQTDPAIDGNLVAWADMWTGTSNIWAAELSGDAIADCPAKVAGDVNGDCKTDMADLAQLASNWLACDLDPATACAN